jgi:hypothetical protein
MTRDEPIATLQAELAAIELWDREYFRSDHHERCEVSAYHNRKQRRDEILRQIGNIEITAGNHI